jgi:hypothetical protein
MDDILAKAKNILFSRKKAYATLFGGIDADTQIVLKDLAKFCRANETTFKQDARLHAVLEGRREVWLRIQKHLNLTPDELWELSRKDTYE